MAVLAANQVQGWSCEAWAIWACFQAQRCRSSLRGSPRSNCSPQGPQFGSGGHQIRQIGAQYTDLEGRRLELSSQCWHQDAELELRIGQALE